MRNSLLIFFFWSLPGQVLLVAQATKVTPLPLVSSVEYNAGQVSSLQTTALHAEIHPQLSGKKWAVAMRSVSSRKHYEDDIAVIKASKQETKLRSYDPVEESGSRSAGLTPVLGTNFEANWLTESTPPDNTMAISNSGMIVTANNDGIEYYTSAGTFLYFDFWSDFFHDNTLTSSIYDPRVIYDSGADRFVMVVLHGSSASTSKVLVCFSKTNNPQNGWWIYTLTGNPLGNNCWFDYPSLGVSNHEIYITGNLFVTGGSFNQAVIYQIPKAAGYAGGSLDWQYWSGLSSSPFRAFSLVPASYGHQGNYGPGIYLISSESSGNAVVRLWDITDDMSGAPQLNSHTISTTAYSLPADAYQLGSEDALDNGDCRTQSAFYLNGILHFVLHTDIGNGWNGIHYNRLHVGTSTNQSSTFGLQGSFDYSYPAVVPFSTTVTSPSVMIGFLRTSSEIYPQIRVVHCDQSMEWSNSILVKSGETYVDIGGNTERWGDYTGIARRHNSASGRIWMAGSYGANIPSQFVTNTYKTWIAEIYGNSTVSLEEADPLESYLVFPNPVYDLVQIRFSLDQQMPLTITVYDMQGKAIRELYRDTPRAGTYQLSFNRDALPAGTYAVVLRSHHQILRNEKIVVAD